MDEAITARLLVSPQSPTLSFFLPFFPSLSDFGVSQPFHYFSSSSFLSSSSSFVTFLLLLSAPPEKGY